MCEGIIYEYCEVNYKELLQKYIKHVESCEGVNFINCIFSDIEFTEQELIELNSFGTTTL